MKYIRKTPLGPAIVSTNIAETVWKVFFPRRKDIKILKRLHLRDRAVFCKFAWKLAGKRRPPKIVKTTCISFVKDITSHKEDIRSDSQFCVTEVERVTYPHDKDGARVISKGNEFVTEIAVSKCLEIHVNPFLPSPTFCVAKASWKSNKFGNIAMEHAGTTLGDCIDDLSLDELRSISMQVAVALSWAQKNVHFKHHDLHSGNIYVTRKRVPPVWTTPSGISVTLPSVSVQARISDFGLSSATDPITYTRHCRIDYDSLNIQNKRVWGEWNDALKGNEGYDFLFFAYENISTKNVSKASFFSDLVDVYRIGYPATKISKKEGRPLVDTPISPDQIVGHLKYSSVSRKL
jgi:hypothetical protein